MESIRELYKVGFGPSSSHTMGPAKAAQRFKDRNPKAKSFTVTLYGSLASTGKGHLTDYIIEKTLSPIPIEFIWKPKETQARHTNAMFFQAKDEDGHILNEWMAYSVGGGKVIDDNNEQETDHVYQHQTMEEILAYCEKNGLQLWQYVMEMEGDDIMDFLKEIWQTMKRSIKRGLDEEGTLPGVLKIPRKAASYYSKAKNFSGGLERRSVLYAYALAVSEENAAGHTVVTAPTCGSCGVMPAVLRYTKQYYDASENKILRALATAGLIGNLVKHNASISGAEVGCQGEVGTACSMASAAITQILGGSIYQIEYAAEMGLEHHLGLTCDPVAGLVQIPCIERNAFAASRAINHSTFVLLSDGRHRISFDEVVETMKKTGHDLPSLYKETSEGGLAIFHNKLGRYDDI